MQTPNRKPGKDSQIKNDPLLTKAKFSELEKKLERLIHFSRPRAAEEVARMAQMGDFSENTGYQYAKGRLRGINSAILNIENQLKNAVIIEPQKQTDTVQVGHKVTVECNEKQKTYQILGSTETNPRAGIISHNSPLGAALVGRSVGDIIKIKLADKEAEYKIIKIMA